MNSMNIRSLISYLTVFLSGVFLSLFISTARLIDVPAASTDVSHLHKSQSSKVKELQATIQELQTALSDERKKLRELYGNYTNIIKREGNKSPTAREEDTPTKHNQRKRIYCPRCIWHIAMAGKKSLCYSRKAYLMEKMKNATAVDVLMRRDQPACYIEHIAMEEMKEQQHLLSSSPYRTINPQRGTSGKWVQDWNYARRNAFIDHVRFYTWGLRETKDFSIETSLQRNATSYKWIDDNALVTEITLDGFCQVAYHLNITRVLIIGDSLSQDFRRSLEAHLGFSHPGKHEIKSLFEQLVYDQFELPCEQSVNDPNFRGVTTAFVKMNGLRESRTGVIDVTRSGRADMPDFVASNPNKTALIFNIGAHMPNLEDYKIAFDVMLRWIDSWRGNDDVHPNKKLYAFFRETVPGHPGCQPQGTALMNMSTNDIEQLLKQQKELAHKEQFELTKADGTKPYTNYHEYLASSQSMMQAAQLQQQQSDEISASSWKWYDYDFKHANGTVEAFNEYSRSVFSRRNHHNQTTGNLLQVHWLNIYNSTVLRKDGHVAFGDCLHYLQPGPYSNWVHLFYSGLLDLARMQHVI